MNGWLEGGVVVPGVVGRSEWELEEAAKDVEVLGWVARFRFVTGALVGQRFGASVQRANARLRRLEGVGLIERETGQVGQARAVWVSRAGLEVLGQRGRGQAAGRRAAPS
ncbi:MAG: hypothetical protein M3459_03955 [Actinomycetota bacterium]|nr:hypothetical protein [Actinomycetota bacterium]